VANDEAELEERSERSRDLSRVARTVNHTIDGGTYQEVIIGRKTVTFMTDTAGAWARSFAASDGAKAA
jgi:hypothetical protein